MWFSGLTALAFGAFLTTAGAYLPLLLDVTDTLGESLAESPRGQRLNCPWLKSPCRRRVC